MNQADAHRRRRAWLGAFVIVAVVLFVLGLVRADALRELLDPGRTLRIVLPDEGLFGLAEGARIEVLGTSAGAIEHIVIDPDQKIYAIGRLRGSMAPFVRRNSRGIIRKTFGVAGEAYLEITRGTGEPMSWDYAVIEAEPDRAPTESIGEMIADVRSRVIPILDETTRTMTALADITERFSRPEGDLQVTLANLRATSDRIARGEGTVGRLVTEEDTAREVEALLTGARTAVERLDPVLAELHAVVRELAGVTRAINERSGDLPEISGRVRSALVSLDGILADLRATSPQLPGITRSAEDAVRSLPALIGTTQQTVAELEALLRQLRGSWLLGGGSGGETEGAGRIPAREVRP